MKEVLKQAFDNGVYTITIHKGSNPPINNKFQGCGIKVSQSMNHQNASYSFYLEDGESLESLFSEITKRSSAFKELTKSKFSYE